MKTQLLLFSGVMAIVSSCSTAYKARQTPDDVYYSPAPQRSTYVNTYTQEDKKSYGYNNAYNLDSYSAPLGMNNFNYSPYYPGIYSPGLSFGYSPFLYGSSFYNPDYLLYPYISAGIAMNPLYYNSFDYYGGYYAAYPYSPYYYGHRNSLYFAFNYPSYLYNNSQSTSGNYVGPRRYNLTVYNPQNPFIIEQPTGQQVNPAPAPVRTIDGATAAPRRQQSIFRRIFTPARTNVPVVNNNSPRNFNTNNYNPPSPNRVYTPPPTRTFQPATQSNFNSAGGGGSSSSGGGSAPVRTFRR